MEGGNDVNIPYYPINEEAARRANDVNSFRDYAEGSTTAAYRRQVDEAAKLAERQKARVDAEHHGKIDRLLDTYSRKLAENYNKRSAIDARVPSILITGGSNFPVAKKEKQNAARDRNMEEYRDIQGILDKIRSVGMGGIMSDDKNAIAKLTSKTEALERLQAHMKAVNAYYRKHKSLDGCPDLYDGEAEKIKASMFASWRASPVPFESYEISTNNANIRRIRQRIETLEKEAQRAESAAKEPEQGDGFILQENYDIGRIQFLFDDKPDEDTRSLLKSHGFRWAPSEGAWQRLLNDNGRSAARAVKAALEKEA
nr:hypothetical protein [Intestinimonas butyriciproducens]